MKRSRSKGSLRRRLMVRLALMLSLLLLLAAIVSYWNARNAADTAYDRSLLSSARTIAERLFDADGQLQVDVPYIALDNFAYDITGRLYYQVLGLQGEAISGYEDLPGPPEGVPMTENYPALARFYNADYRGTGVRVVSLLQPVSGGEWQGMAEVRVAETLNARTGMARHLLQRSLINLSVLSISALLLAYLTVNAALGPLWRVKDEVANRRSDDLSPISTDGLQREITPLVDAINHFTGQLRENFERQRDFIAEAAHELRTPLAALKARIELGLRATEAASWRQALQDAEVSTDRTISLANRLLSIARIERGARAVADGSAEYVLIQPLVQDVAMAMVPLAYEQGIELALEVQQPFAVWGEPTLLQEMLGNLIDNALAHTPAGGQVVLRLKAPACLEVEDNGPGIPEAERGRVFERFYRQGSAGSGLGLSIVGEICRAHRAVIKLDEGTMGGLLVSVNFSRPSVAPHQPRS